MKLDNPEARKPFRGLSHCQNCGQWAGPTGTECAHVLGKGNGGGSVIDHPLNMLGIGTYLGCGCHVRRCRVPGGLHCVRKSTAGFQAKRTGSQIVGRCVTPRRPNRTRGSDMTKDVQGAVAGEAKQRMLYEKCPICSGTGQRIKELRSEAPVAFVHKTLTTCICKTGYVPVGGTGEVETTDAHD